MYQKRKKFAADIVSTEVDGIDFAANPSLDTTPLFQSASRENASVVAPSEVQIHLILFFCLLSLIILSLCL